MLRAWLPACTCSAARTGRCTAAGPSTSTGASQRTTPAARAATRAPGCPWSSHGRSRSPTARPHARGGADQAAPARGEAGIDRRMGIASVPDRSFGRWRPLPTQPGRLARPGRAQRPAARHARDARARPARVRRRRAAGGGAAAACGPSTFAFFHPDAVRHAMATEADRYRKDSRFYRRAALVARRRAAQQPGRALEAPAPLHPAAVHPQADRELRRGDGRGGRGAEPRWRAARRRRPIDLHAEMSRVTLRIVGRLLFGADVERARAGRRVRVPGARRVRAARAYSPVRLPRSCRSRRTGAPAGRRRRSTPCATR